MTNILSSLASMFAILLLVSELLPYASSSKCNSLLEGVSHIFCYTSCLVSNKNIRFENEEMKQEIVNLKTDKRELVDEIDYLKQVVLANIADDIKKLRTSFELHKNNGDNNKPLNNIVIEE